MTKFVTNKITNKTMSKPTKKRINFNPNVLDILVGRYDYSKSYIKASVRGDRTGVMPDILIKEYKKLELEAEKLNADAVKTLQEKAENLNI